MVNYKRPPDLPFNIGKINSNLMESKCQTSVFYTSEK